MKAIHTKLQDTQELENILRTLLPYFLITILISTICGAFIGYIEHNGWRIGDWLISYSEGFVRRGIFGEFIITLSKITSLNPGLLVVLFQSLFYSIYFYYSYLLLKRSNLIFFAMLVFSPFIFTFQLNDFQGGYRKEIIYYALLSFLAYAKVSYSNKTFELLFFTFLIFFSLAVLSHEMLAGFAPYLIAVYALNNRLTPRKYFLLFLCSIPFMTSFLACIYHDGTVEQIIAIRQTLEDMNYEVRGGAISWINKSVVYGFNLVRNSLSDHSFYPVILILSLIAFIPVYSDIRLLLKNQLILILLLCSITSTIVVSAIALDWGRFLNVNLVSLFILSLVSSNLSNTQHNHFKSKKISKLLIFFIILWAMCFRIPHCCGNYVFSRSFNEINLVNYVMPIYRLYKITD